MDFLAPVRRFDGLQQRHRWLAIPMAVIKKFGDDQGGSLAALVSYFAFFSLFPLLLVFVTILGFVLQGDTSAQHAVERSVLGQFPVIGNQIHANALHGSLAPLIIGLVTSLLGGLGVTNATQNAFDRVWAVPFKDRADFLKARLRGLALLVALGLLFVVATLASGLVIGGLGGPLVKVAGIALSLLLNFALFLAAFRFMTSASVGTSCLWVGVFVAGILWEILQLIGGYYIGHVFKHSTSTYGTFGLVIALLVWLHLGAQILIYAAEVNVVVNRRLWPRSLFGPPTEPADQQTLTALAKVEERHEQERIDVEFKG
ncbi:MAG TPA: YihY/virulence factor BrkB family protein [Solirubrobacteraceae bacterium]|jgi:YihY family inner membrane protein